MHWHICGFELEVGIEGRSLEFVVTAMSLLGFLLLVQLNQLQALVPASPDDKSCHTFLIQPGRINTGS